MLKKFILFFASVLFHSFSFSQTSNTVVTESVNKKEKDPRDRIVIILSADNLFHKGPNGFKTKWYSRGISLAYMYDIPFAKNRLSFAPGIGFSHASYNNNSILVEDTSGISFEPIENLADAAKYKRSKIAVNYLDIPLEFRIFSKPFKNGRFLKAAFGFKTSIRLTSVSRIVKEEMGYNKKIKTKNYRDFMIVKAGPTFRFGYAGFSVYAHYSVTHLFKKDKGPVMTPFTIGLCITGL